MTVITETTTYFILGVNIAGCSRENQLDIDIAFPLGNQFNMPMHNSFKSRISNMYNMMSDG